MGIERVRMEAMFNSMGSGIKKTDDLVRNADHAEMPMKLSRGKSSMYHFFDISSEFGIVEKVFLATRDEDMHFGTDAWMVLKPNHPFKILPVQIKSSVTGIDEFKASHVFKRIGEAVLVLNTREGRKHKEIIQDFFSEYGRVVSRIKQIKDTGDTSLDFIFAKKNT